MTMADLGKGAGEPVPPLFLDQTEAQRAEKDFLRSLSLTQGLNDHLPPYLPVWIRHCMIMLVNFIDRLGNVTGDTQLYIGSINSVGRALNCTVGGRGYDSLDQINTPGLIITEK